MVAAYKQQARKVKALPGWVASFLLPLGSPIRTYGRPVLYEPRTWAKAMPSYRCGAQPSCASFAKSEYAKSLTPEGRSSAPTVLLGRHTSRSGAHNAARNRRFSSAERSAGRDRPAGVSRTSVALASGAARQEWQRPASAARSGSPAPCQRRGPSGGATPPRPPRPRP